MWDSHSVGDTGLPWHSFLSLQISSQNACGAWHAVYLLGGTIRCTSCLLENWRHSSLKTNQHPSCLETMNVTGTVKGKGCLGIRGTEHHRASSQSLDSSRLGPGKRVPLHGMLSAIGYNDSPLLLDTLLLDAILGHWPKSPRGNRGGKMLASFLVSHKHQIFSFWPPTGWDGTIWIGRLCHPAFTAARADGMGWQSWELGVWYSRLFSQGRNSVEVLWAPHLGCLGHLSSLTCSVARDMLMFLCSINWGWEMALGW